MFAWLVTRAEHTAVLAAAIPKAWTGGDAVATQLAVPERKPRQIIVVRSDRAKARRAPRWPDLLADWREIYDDEELFPGGELPVLGEELSGLGAPSVCVYAGPGLARATVAWYEQGALIGFDHVGGASVSWTPEGGLGRPFDGTAASIAALGGKQVAKLFGSDRDIDVLERVEHASRAVGGVLLTRAFYRIIGAEPPAIDDLAGMVAQAAETRLHC